MQVGKILVVISPVTLWAEGQPFWSGKVELYRTASGLLGCCHFHTDSEAAAILTFNFASRP